MSFQVMHERLVALTARVDSCEESLAAERKWRMSTEALQMKKHILPNADWDQAQSATLVEKAIVPKDELTSMHSAARQVARKTMKRIKDDIVIESAPIKERSSAEPRSEMSGPTKPGPPVCPHPMPLAREVLCEPPGKLEEFDIGVPEHHCYRTFAWI